MKDSPLLALALAGAISATAMVPAQAIDSVTVYGKSLCSGFQDLACQQMQEAAEEQNRNELNSYGGRGDGPTIGAPPKPKPEPVASAADKFVELTAVGIINTTIGLIIAAAFSPGVAFVVTFALFTYVLI